MSQKPIRVGRASVEQSLRDSKFVKGLQGSLKQLEKLGVSQALARPKADSRVFQHLSHALTNAGLEQRRLYAELARLLQEGLRQACEDVEVWGFQGKLQDVDDWIDLALVVEIPPERIDTMTLNDIYLAAKAWVRRKGWAERIVARQKLEIETASKAPSEKATADPRQNAKEAVMNATALPLLVGSDWKSVRIQDVETEWPCRDSLKKTLQALDQRRRRNTGHDGGWVQLNHARDFPKRSPEQIKAIKTYDVQRQALKSLQKWISDQGVLPDRILQNERRKGWRLRCPLQQFPRAKIARK